MTLKGRLLKGRASSSLDLKRKLVSTMTEDRKDFHTTIVA
jgi:hypothetical protein